MRLDKFDFAIIALYLAGITLFGLRFRKRQRTLRDYFLADRSVPWWAIALSIVAAETSTLTVISVPGLAYERDFGFLQLVLGYLVGRVVISFLFIPQYFRGELFTAYQLIDRRFGRVLHKFTAGLFLATRAAAEGVRVFAVSIVIGIALGTGDVWSIAIILLLTFVYTLEGGMAAVIWTDIVQRLLSARTERDSKTALISSGVFVLVQFALFLLVGAMLFVFYRLFPPMVAFERSDRIFPTFVVTQMPHVISGLLVAAILAAAMSNLSAALNSLSSSTIVDFYLRLRPSADERRRMVVSRMATVFWAFVL